MKILTRYVIRAHVGPFFFAFTAVTGLLFLNAVAQRVEDLAGRGLELSVVGEFMLLSIPHIVALTLPMSVLVAVLYAFSELTGHNEIAAMAAGGIHPARLMAPLMGVGLVFSGLMFVFNDRILPESNHRLSSLLADVGSKSPTFQLREEIINPIHTGDDSHYFLRAKSIDTRASLLQDVTIYDLTNVTQVRTILAKRGKMSFTPDGRDLYLTLNDGVVYEVTDDRPGSFQRLKYATQILPFRGVRDELERQGTGASSDREMDIAGLQARIAENITEMRRMGDEGYLHSREALDAALGVTPGREQLAVGSPPSVEEPPLEFSRDEVMRNLADLYRVDATRWSIREEQNFRYLVEVHKKYAIAFACLIFVLLGPPLAIRFPQGGAGMVIAASVGIFFFYWMGLIGGERFADRGQLDPALAMWAPNVLLLIPAAFFASRMAKQISTNRGSSWDEFVFRAGRFARRATGRWDRRASAGEQA
ncbi:MAG: YjgP/YjgQ family permease [Gemmatimonadetes bacterium]|nr:YjgP/YjgQ family permease [Gemmatimonadota bacterium]